MKWAVTRGWINVQGEAGAGRLSRNRVTQWLQQGKGEKQRHASMLGPRARDACPRLLMANGCHCDGCHSVRWQTKCSLWPVSLCHAGNRDPRGKALGSPEPSCLQHLLCSSMPWALPRGRGGTSPVSSWAGWSQHESLTARYGPCFFGNNAQLAAAWLSTSLTQLGQGTFLTKAFKGKAWACYNSVRSSCLRTGCSEQKRKSVSLILGGCCMSTKCVLLGL